ncbi:MAG: hypothetical protein FWD66_00860 [Paludibacter sp.]|nr:hypothetical protein [Paludibacter sp.]
MATVTFYYDDNSISAQKTLDFLMSLGLFKKQPPKISSLEQSLKDIEEGRVYRLVNRKK